VRLPWTRSAKPRPSPRHIGARCSGCRRELPLTYEQGLLLADDRPVWLFCPLCARIVWAEAFTREGTAEKPEPYKAYVSFRPAPMLASVQAHDCLERPG